MFSSTILGSASDEETITFLETTTKSSLAELFKQCSYGTVIKIIIFEQETQSK